MTRHLAPKPQDLADALGTVREKIKALKAREADLRSALLDARLNGPVAGHRFAVSIRESTRRSIDTQALPDSILRDDRFWKTSVTRTVLTRSLAPAAPPPQEEDLQLIEPN